MVNGQSWDHQHLQDSSDADSECQHFHAVPLNSFQYFSLCTMSEQPTLQSIEPCAGLKIKNKSVIINNYKFAIYISMLQQNISPSICCWSDQSAPSSTASADIWLFNPKKHIFNVFPALFYSLQIQSESGIFFHVLTSFSILQGFYLLQTI